MSLRSRLIIAAAGAGIAATVLGYGYWHAATHATLDVYLAQKMPSTAQNPPLNGQLEFLDETGALLARATTDAKHGVVWIAHPVRGPCGPDLAQRAYLDCFKAQSVWIPGWVQRIRYANVTSGRCSTNRLPVKLAEYRDNLLLWWLPLPHVGGLPYTRYSATLAVNTRNCL